MTAKGRAWIGLLATGAAALAVVVASDLGLRAVLPPAVHPEVEDGLEALATCDPTVLVLGSSHLRTFQALADELERRTGGRQRMAPVPVDWGHLSSYGWTWEHRLRPLVDVPDPPDDTAPRHLKRVVLVTQWWDFRRPAPGDDPLVNLPARAWTFGDWLADAWGNGVTPYNQNYVMHRWQRLLRGSALVAYRGRTAVLDWVRDQLAPAADPGARQRYEQRLRWFQGYVERGGERLVDPADARALDDLLDDWAALGWDVTVVLYPRMKGMITPSALRGTLEPFARWIGERVRARGFRLVDLSLEHPLADADFGPDLDHPTDAANRRFADWALDGPLSFLLADAPPGDAGVAGGAP